VAAFTDYLEGAFINASLRGVNFTAPTSVFVSAHTAAPTDAAPSTGESGGTSYARVAVASTTANWAAPGAGGTTSNNNAITWPAAGSNWGTITHIAIWDAATNGNALYHGALTASKAVDTGDTLQIAAGELDITLA
jgi:hypothetical protein